MSRPTAHQGSRNRSRKRTRFPIDPALLAQRPLNGSDQRQLPEVTLKTGTHHPTVYRKRIAQVSAEARHGDLVRVITSSGEFVGLGLWNPRAEATVRILSWQEQDNLGSIWSERLQSALRLRETVIDPEQTNACRLINAEGDGLPGLTVDRFDNTLSLEVFSLAMLQRAEAIARELTQLSGTEHWTVRCGPRTLEQEGFAAEGFCSEQCPEKVTIQEHGVRYELHPSGGQKTGFFCDQRENRLQLRRFCRGRRVLDLCCYTGGFALNAALAGAAEVTAVDLDEEAIRLAKRNAQINRASLRFVHADAFSYLRDMQRNGNEYDVIILDPPKLIRQRDEAAQGRSKYFDLNRLAAALVAEGGLLLTCSCSGLLSPEEFTRTVRAATSGRQPRLLFRSGAGPDHPVALNCLETEYLKCLWLQMGAHAEPASGQTD